MTRRKNDPHDWRAVYPNKSDKTNYLKAVKFQSPEWIPCSMSIYGAVWRKYRERLAAIVEKHPFIFGSKILNKRFNYDRISDWHKVGLHSDNWGCTWQVVHEGYEGQVIVHPLANWSALATYQFPDPLKYTERGKRASWHVVKLGSWLANKTGILFSGSGERLFDRLYFLRGFDNLMHDIASNDPNLQVLINRFIEHELVLVKKWLSVGVDQMSFHTDIGMQDRLMISPRSFRKHIKPMYAAIFAPCKDAGVPVYLSSDGYLLDIVDDLVEVGVTTHDPQQRANTIEGIQKHYKGKMCIDLDLDRQGFPFMSPEQIKGMIKQAVALLSSPEGGFMMKAEIGDPAIPLENIQAICEAFEENCIPRR
ncbi:MAG: uroporphyrinogen decarboxylase family protein [Candidatus Sigynarchaeota archaeon]